MKITAIEVTDNGRRLREVKIYFYNDPNDYAEVMALRGKYKEIIRDVPLANLRWWQVDA